MLIHIIFIFILQGVQGAAGKAKGTYYLVKDHGVTHLYHDHVKYKCLIFIIIYT